MASGLALYIEPGYYEDGAFGIRIENVVLVKEVETKHKFGGKPYLSMEPVTMVTMYMCVYTSSVHCCLVSQLLLCRCQFRAR